MENLQWLFGGFAMALLCFYGETSVVVRWLCGESVVVVVVVWRLCGGWFIPPLWLLCDYSVDPLTVPYVCVRACVRECVCVS